ILPLATAQSVKFTEHKLKNGLRIILSEDHSAPTYSISVTYNVGSRDERDGRTGFAHLFEHMMFQGSENVGKGEHFIIIENNAGLTLVGDFKTAEALQKIEKYFATIPNQPAPRFPDMSEPKQSGERRKILEDPLAQVARLDVAFKIPPGNTPDWYALYVLGE